MPVALRRKLCYNTVVARKRKGILGSSTKELLQMKREYKIKTNNKIETTAISNEAVRAEVSFIMVSKGVLGFRESARLIEIAKSTDCTISIASGKKYGSNDSILSLVNLGINKGKSLVLNIKGERNEEAFREVSKIIGGETDSNI